MPRWTRQDFEFIADEIAPFMHWPTNIKELSQKLKRMNPRFDADKFERRAIAAWEERYQESLEELNDEIPY